MEPNIRTQARWGSWVVARGEAPRRLAPCHSTKGSSSSRSRVSGFFVPRSVAGPNGVTSQIQTEREMP